MRAARGPIGARGGTIGKRDGLAGPLTAVGPEIAPVARRAGIPTTAERVASTGARGNIAVGIKTRRGKAGRSMRKSRRGRVGVRRSERGRGGSANEKKRKSGERRSRI